MALATAITLPDAAATPLNHAFAPVEVGNGLARYLNRSANGGVISGFEELTIGTRLASKQNGGQKVTARMILPKMDATIPTAPVVAYAMFGSVEFVLPNACSLQDRKDLYKLMCGLIAHAVFKTSIEDLDSPIQ